MTDALTDYRNNQMEAPARYAELKRLVVTSMLWENEGRGVEKRIAELVPLLPAIDVGGLAVYARNSAYLRHMPLYLMRQLALYTAGHAAKTGRQHLVSGGDSVSRAIRTYLPMVIQRADELAEFMAMVWKDGKSQPSAVKRAMAESFERFDEYQLAKWDRTKGRKIIMKYAMGFCHAKPGSEERSALYRRLKEGKLAMPDTWEIALSKAGRDRAARKAAWERLLRERKLPGMATLQNLRNMQKDGVDEDLIAARLRAGIRYALPFRFIKAKDYVAATLRPALQDSMFKSLEGRAKLPGRTVMVIDVSGSMGSPTATKSDLTRLDAARALAILARELCEDPVVYATAGNDSRGRHATIEIDAEHRGFDLGDAVMKSRAVIGGGGIFLRQVMEYIAEAEGRKPGARLPERVIVFTDEQDCGRGDAKQAQRLGRKGNYIANVSNDKKTYGEMDGWGKIDGFSELTLDFIREYEKL